MIDRLDQQTDNTLVAQLKQLTDDVRELKTGVQYTEAKMYEYSSGSSYDITGSLASGGPRNILALVVITATSVDGGSFISTFTPEVWIPDMSTPYHDTLASPYAIDYNQIVTDDVTKTQFWYRISANASVSASTFFLKAHIYATSPVTVTYARII